MKTIKRIALITVCISILYIALSELLTFTELSLRTWVNVMGQIILVLITPLMLVILILMLLYRNKRIHRIIKIVCAVAAVFGYIFCAFYLFLFILFGTQEEKILTRHLLVTDESGFLGESNYVYYRPVAFFFKTPGEITNADRLEYLEKKYKKEFVVNESGDAICDPEFPEMEVSVYLTREELTDNYIEEMTLWYLLQGYDELGIERDYYLLNLGTEDRDYMCLRVDGRSDISVVAEDISEMIDYTMDKEMADNASSIYQENLGRIYFSFGKDEQDYTGVIYFGGKERGPLVDIEAVVSIAYQQEFAGEDEQGQPLKEAHERYEDTTGRGYEEEDTPAYIEEEPEPDYREEAAKVVYDAVLAKEGYSYEVCYNAKGNLYIDLGSKESEDDKTYYYRLVYDRPSKNGACELFVLYRSAGGMDEEVIEDMYAVEMNSGKVVISGKKAWSDVGTNEYRELTGE
ncbi:MAG: hypothetical protein K2J99_12210 [Lachnospiraceae bacterium]|nr:hypothetical protein [Lachnospiraceae bacterium]